LRSYRALALADSHTQGIAPLSLRAFPSKLRRFGSVTGFFKPAPSPKPRQKPKSLAPHRYIFSVNALGFALPAFQAGKIEATKNEMRPIAGSVQLINGFPMFGNVHKKGRR
jgi:hypothetical protein